MSESNCQHCSLLHHCLLGRLEPAERADLQPLTHQRILQRGEVLADEAQVATTLRMLKLGTVFVYRRGLDGRSRPIGILPRGAALGILAMLGRPNPATAMAMGTVRICEIPLDALRSALGCAATLGGQLIDSLVKNVAAMATWSEAMRLPKVTDRLAYMLLLLTDTGLSAALELPNQVDLAELLGSRRESIARALRGLAADGDIELGERRRCVVDRGRLLARLQPAGPVDHRAGGAQNPAKNQPREDPHEQASHRHAAGVRLSGRCDADVRHGHAQPHRLCECGLRRGQRI